MTDTAPPRAVCGRCRRPVSVCVCTHVPTLTPATRVVILQHPREHRMPIGTARMAARCLVGSRLAVGTDLDAHPTVVDALRDPGRRAVLLWPGPDALDLHGSPPRGPTTLFVVDGTWAQAKKLIKENPGIAALPRYGLAPAAPSEYRIRRPPRAECLSTVEALAAALGALEGEPERYRAMLTPFRAMVETQLAYMARSTQPRFLSLERRQRRSVWVPPETLRAPERVVVVAAETNAWPFHAKQTHPDEVVHWLAIRGDASERFESVVRPTHPPAPGVEVHTGLAADVLLAGAPRADLLERFGAFVRDGDTLATWGAYGRGLVADAGFERTHPVVDLRRVAADWLRGSPGSIERCVADLGLDAPPLGPGRAGRRLGLMLAVLRQVLQPRRARRPVPSR